MRNLLRSFADFSWALSVFSMSQTAKVLRLVPKGNAPDATDSFDATTTVMKRQFGTLERELYKTGHAFQSALLGEANAAEAGTPQSSAALPTHSSSAESFPWAGGREGHGRAAAARFHDNRDGTVTDGSTGLIWMKNAGCFGKRSWQEAGADVAGLGSGRCGLTDESQPGDWRLASLDELLTLLDYRFVPSLADTRGNRSWRQGDPFVDVAMDGVYWSGTSSAEDPDHLAWFVYFGGGNLARDFKDRRHHVWPVRGSRPSIVPRYTDNGDGTVTDNRTQLIWMKNANCFGLRTFDDAQRDVAGLQSGQCGLSDGSRPGDWRMPTVGELTGAVDYRFENYALSNLEGTGHWQPGNPFDNLGPSTLTWTGTQYAGDAKAAWVVLLSNGSTSTTTKFGFFYVWPVRDGKG